MYGDSWTIEKTLKEYEKGSVIASFKLIEAERKYKTIKRNHKKYIENMLYNKSKSIGFPREKGWVILDFDYIDPTWFIIVNSYNPREKYYVDTKTSQIKSEYHREETNKYKRVSKALDEIKTIL